jgi:hypothetical protein
MKPARGRVKRTSFGKDGVPPSQNENQTEINNEATKQPSFLGRFISW